MAVALAKRCNAKLALVRGLPSGESLKAPGIAKHYTNPAANDNTLAAATPLY
jgi:hypothetical protein